MRNKYRRGIDIVDKPINKKFLILLLIAISIMPTASAVSPYAGSGKAIFGSSFNCGICHVSIGGPMTDFGNSFAAQPNHITDPTSALLAISTVFSIGGDIESKVGENISILVNVTNASEIGSIQGDLLFDPAILNAESVTVGNLATGAIIEFNINNTNGKISIGGISTSGITGTGTLAQINFSAKSAGTSKLNISISDITNTTNSPIITYRRVNGTLTVIGEEIIDKQSPVIENVQLSNNNPSVGDQINITVTATDDIGVTNVSSDIYAIGNTDLGIVLTEHIDLVKEEGTDIWSEKIVAKEGNYSVNVSARDAAGNVTWDNSTTYNVVASVQPIVSFEFGVANSALTVEQDVSADYTLTVKNTGESIDTYYFTIYNPNSAIVELLETNIDADVGQESTTTLTVIGNVTGTYTVDVTATSKNNDTLNKTVRTVTTVIPPVPRYIKEFGVGNGAIAGFIIGNVAVTNIDSVDHWFLVVVGGTDPIVGYPLVGTGTVYLKANESINVPILVSVPAGAIAGDYELYAGIYNYDDRIIAPEKLLEPIKGPVISTVS